MKNRFTAANCKIALIAAALALCAGHDTARADERSELEQLRATTMSLIEALVETGAITREKADKLIQAAEQKAKERVAQSASAGTAAASPAEVGADGRKIVRVPYVPESVRREIREQVKQDVMAQAKEERWANPNVLPEWLDRFTFEGDLRLRYDGYKLDPTNTPSGPSAKTITRAADFYNNTGNPTFNTQEDYSRTRLRARFGFTAKISDLVSAGMLISTGSTSGPTSTNQTIGQNFNKYSLGLDRGFIALKPTPTLTLTGGRFANPFMGTDLVWAEDLNFEGVVASYKPQLTPNFGAFLTAGWFPLRTDNPLQTVPANLTGGQAGIDWNLSPRSRLKIGAALYQYHGIVGAQETDARYNGGTSVADYGATQYPAGLRQRGNTLFAINSPADLAAGNPLIWGLASDFRELNLTGNLDISTFGENHVLLIGDYVNNLAFNRAQMAVRTGNTIIDGKSAGYLGKLLVGQPLIRNAGEWNVSLAYRWLGSDAVLDAYTNSDFGLGGTNNKGYILGANYGLDRQTWLSVRWMASNLIDSMVPSTTGAAATPTKLSTDLLQVDLNVKF